jgi:hypothetical protein
MKKLLILMLVLGMASAANAASAELYLKSGGLSTLPATAIGTTITVDLYVDVDLAGINKVDFGFGTATGTMTKGSWFNAGSTSSAGDDSSGTSIVDAYWNKSGGAADYQKDTIMYSFSVGVTTGGTILPIMNTGDAANRGFTQYTAAENTYTPLTILPEPMTIALLGLGGLFLRRRR